MSEEKACMAVSGSLLLATQMQEALGDDWDVEILDPEDMVVIDSIPDFYRNPAEFVIIDHKEVREMKEYREPVKYKTERANIRKVQR